MESFIIEGGQSLKGSIKPQGAKNEALQILCATLLTSEPIIVNNIPNILDVNKLIQILTNLGVEIEKIGEGKYRFCSNNINLDYLSSQNFKDEGQM